MKTLNNFLFQDRDLAHDIYLRSLHRITQVYLFLMLLVFPFYSTNCYFHILRDRRNFFLCVTGVYLSGLLLTLLCRIPREERGVIRQRCRLMKTDWLLLIFLCSATVGMILSGNVKVVFLGTDGRYQGLLMWVLYGILAHESGSDPSVFIGRYHFFGMGNYGFFRYGYLRLDWPCKTGTANHVFFFLRKHQYLYRCHFIGRRCISWHDCFCRDNAA